MCIHQCIHRFIHQCMHPCHACGSTCACKAKKIDHCNQRLVKTKKLSIMSGRPRVVIEGVRGLLDPTVEIRVPFLEIKRSNFSVFFIHPLSHFSTRIRVRVSVSASSSAAIFLDYCSSFPSLIISHSQPLISSLIFTYPSDLRNGKQKQRRPPWRLLLLPLSP